MMDGKSQEWRDAADKLLEALARENRYIVADMVIIFLESAGFGLDDYSPLGGVFKRAAKKGIIRKIDRPTKQALWASRAFNPDRVVVDLKRIADSNPDVYQHTETLGEVLAGFRQREDDHDE